MLNSLIEQSNVPALTPFIADLTRLRDAIAAGADISITLNDLSTVLGNLGGVLQTSPDALPFELALQPNSATALPNTPTRFDVALRRHHDRHLQSEPVRAARRHHRRTQPNQRHPRPWPIYPRQRRTERLRYPRHRQQLAPASFSVTATLNGNSNATRTAEGAFTVRDELVEVVSVAATPGFTNPGGSVAVSGVAATNAVNQSRQVQASYTVKHAQGATVFTSSPRPAQLLPGVRDFPVHRRFGQPRYHWLPARHLHPERCGRRRQRCSDPRRHRSRHLLVGSPLSATQALTPDILPPGDGIVTASLNLNSLITLPGPAISLLSLTDTDAIASSLAIRDNLAYVCGTENVTIFDITDPSQPQILATFADNLINGSFNTKCRIVDDHLVVFWQIGTNANALPILVFDLANPTAPNLVSNTNQNRHFISTLFFRDRTAYMALAGIRYSGCFLSSQFRDFATFDF